MKIATVIPFQAIPASEPSEDEIQKMLAESHESLAPSTESNTEDQDIHENDPRKSVIRFVKFLKEQEKEKRKSRGGSYRANALLKYTQISEGNHPELAKGHFINIQF